MFYCYAQHFSAQFTYDHDTNTFTGWASELGSRLFAPVYEDAADLGLTIVSGKTGSGATYYIAEEERDDDNDISLWKLMPTPETIRRLPLLKDTTVIVFND